jgi:hypothetical protein
LESRELAQSASLWCGFKIYKYATYGQFLDFLHTFDLASSQNYFESKEGQDLTWSQVCISTRIWYVRGAHNLYDTRERLSMRMILRRLTEVLGGWRVKCHPGFFQFLLTYPDALASIFLILRGPNAALCVHKNKCRGNLPPGDIKELWRIIPI